MIMIKHLYYLLRSDYKTIMKTDFDEDFSKMGLPIDDNTLIVEDVILDYMGMELLNAPTLFTSFSDFKEHLHYSVRANALKLYHLANVYATLTSDYLKSKGGEKRTLTDKLTNKQYHNESNSHDIDETNTSELAKTGTESNNVDSTGKITGTNENFRKYADTPTKVEASEKFVDKYTTEQENNSNSSTEDNTQNVTSKTTKDLKDNISGTKKVIYGENKIHDTTDNSTRDLTEERFNTTGLPEVLLNIESLRQGLYNEVKKMENKLMYQLLYDIDN